MKIDQIEEAFLKHMDTELPVVVRADLKITDLSKFVSNHISYLRGNSGNALYMPYYERLIETLRYLDKKADTKESDTGSL